MNHPFIVDPQQKMDMVGHDDIPVDKNILKSVWKRSDHGFHDLACPGEDNPSCGRFMNRPYGNRGQKAAPSSGAYRDKIRTGGTVIAGFQTIVFSYRVFHMESIPLDARTEQACVIHRRGDSRIARLSPYLPLAFSSASISAFQSAATGWLMRIRQRVSPTTR